MSMRFGSVCSGIEAASVAWSGLGWHAAWLSEIEAFPSAVLAHHYPQVPNLGDMTQLPELIRAGHVEAPDVFCGGTPCQAFSVAGKRQSLSDARGNLSLTFCEIADAIDDIRRDTKEPACVIFWENVPGVLNTKDNAFGCFLAGLAGEDVPLEPPRGKWANAGAVHGPKRAIAWRVLDAQYFGVAQRRRRVFVVASARDGFDPAAVLFEFDGVRRDSAPSRETGKIAPTIPSRSTAGGGLGTDFDLDGGVITMAHGQGGYAVTQYGDLAGTLTQRHDSSPCADRGMSVLVQQPVLSNDPAHAICANEQRTYTNEGSVFQLRNVVAQPIAIPIISDADRADSSARTPSPDAEGRIRLRDPGLGIGVDGDPMFTLQATKPHAVAAAYPIDMRNALRDPDKHDKQNRQGCGLGDEGDPAPTLTKAHVHGVAVGTDCYNGQITGDVAATMGTPGSSVNASGPTVMQAMQVRRLTPTECERLQGFPDGYTNVPWRGKATSADGPRYKALGNSWAVPVVTWIGRRIHEVIMSNGGHHRSEVVIPATAETAVDMEAWLADADHARDKQHAEEVELLQSKLALALRENRRLSDELKKADEAVDEKDARISATLKERDHYAIELTNALERESQVRADERAKVQIPDKYAALMLDMLKCRLTSSPEKPTDRRTIEQTIEWIESTRAAQDQE